MRMLKLLFPSAVVIAGLVVWTTATYGKPEYKKKEGVKSCTVCHVKVAAAEEMKKDPNLNDVGKCYKDNDHSLAKCDVKK